MNRFPHTKEFPSIPWVLIDRKVRDYDEVDCVLTGYTDHLALNPTTYLSEWRASTHLAVRADALLEAGDPRGEPLARFLQEAPYVVVKEAFPVPFWPNVYRADMGMVPTLFLHNVGNKRLDMRDVLGRFFGALCGEDADIVLSPSPTRGFWVVDVGDDGEAWQFVAWQPKAGGVFVVQPVVQPEEET